MTTAQADYAAAELDDVEVGVLHALASRVTAVADIPDFVRGFCNVDGDALPEDHESVRAALFSLDSLGWCAPANNTNPTDATAWYLTAQGRVALASLSR